MFTPTEVYETEFDGTAVRLELRRLKRREFMQISSSITKNGEINVADVIDILGPVWADHVTVLEPDIPVQDIYEEAWYMSLLARVCNKLMEISVPGEVIGSRSDEPGREPEPAPVSDPT